MQTLMLKIVRESLSIFYEGVRILNSLKFVFLMKQQRKRYIVNKAKKLKLKDIPTALSVQQDTKATAIKSEKLQKWMLIMLLLGAKVE